MHPWITYTDILLFYTALSWQKIMFFSVNKKLPKFGKRWGKPGVSRIFRALNFISLTMVISFCKCEYTTFYSSFISTWRYNDCLFAPFVYAFHETFIFVKWISYAVLEYIAYEMTCRDYIVTNLWMSSKMHEREVICRTKIHILHKKHNLFQYCVWKKCYNMLIYLNKCFFHCELLNKYFKKILYTLKFLLCLWKTFRFYYPLKILKI